MNKINQFFAAVMKCKHWRNENWIMVTTGRICKYPEAEKVLKGEK